MNKVPVLPIQHKSDQYFAKISEQVQNPTHHLSTPLDPGISHNKIKFDKSNLYTFMHKFVVAQKNIFLC